MSAFFDAVGDFFSSLASLHWGALLIGLTSFIVYLTIRARAYFNVLRAAYPDERFEFRRIWGAYMAAYGFNNVVPARGGDIIKLFLTKTSIPNSSYPAVGASFFVEAIFDLCMAIPIMAFAFTQGAFPKPPDFSKLPAGDLAFFASNPRFTLFLLTVLAILALIAFAVLSARVRAFWARVRQGLVILRDRPRYFREVFLVQLGAWAFRFTAFWFLLEAFQVGGSVTNVLLVLGVQRGRRARALHPGRRRRPAGAAGQGLRGHRHAARRSPPTRSGSRSRSPPARSRSASGRSSSSSASAPSRRSSPPGARPAARRRSPRSRPPARRAPGAPRAPASRPRGRPWPSRRGSAAPAGPSCPGC